MIVVSTREFRANLPKEYILAPDEELARAITSKEFLERLIPRLVKIFDNGTILVNNK